MNRTATLGLVLGRGAIGGTHPAGPPGGAPPPPLGQPPTQPELGEVQDEQHQLGEDALAVNVVAQLVDRLHA